VAQFLSDEWVTAARHIYAANASEVPAATQQVQVNLVVKDAPFGDGTVQAHLDTTGTEPELDLGHIDGAPTTITTDYATAKAVFVEQDQQAAMQAFMGGRIQITGDMTKIMMMNANPPTDAQKAAAADIKEMTA
jgi:hypothetical protein